MIFCSVVMVSSNAPRRGASPPRPLRAPPRLAIRRGDQDTSVRLSFSQCIEFDRFGIELVAPCGDGLLALALYRMRGHADDWDVPGLRIALETPHGFPTIVVRHFEVHQDHARVLGRGQHAALLAVLRCEHLEAAAQL